MRNEITPSKGVAYFGYANGRRWLARQNEEGLRRYIDFHGEEVREGHTLAMTADGVFSSIFMRPPPGQEERTVSRWAINVGSETFFDRCPKAIEIFDYLNDEVERQIDGNTAELEGGWAFCSGLVHAFSDFAVASASFKSLEELWWACRALEDSFEDRESNDFLAFLLKGALEHFQVRDDGQSPWGAIGDERGFLPVEEFSDFRIRETAFRVARDSAHKSFLKYVSKTEMFDVEKARSTYEETGGGTAVYFPERLLEGQLRWAEEDQKRKAWLSETKSDSSQSADDNAAKIRAIQENRGVLTGLRPGSDAYIEKYNSFAREELETGYSPYGYWFDTSGAYYPMRQFQGHATWLKENFGVEYGDDMYDAYKRAWSEGWVLMSMSEDLTPEAVIRYAGETVSPEALKSASKMLRRGGIFPGVLIEPHDEDAKPVEFHRFDKVGAAAMHLKQLAKEIENDNTSAPRM